jgi:hypothetical protein
MAGIIEGGIWEIVFLVIAFVAAAYDCGGESLRFSSFATFSDN